MRKLLLAVTIFAGFTQASYAGTVEQQVISRLQAQGYQVLEQSYTFLGRLRIVAQNGSLQREIVVNPGTGEVLRDFAVSMPQRQAVEPAMPEPSIGDEALEAVPPDLPDQLEPYFVANDGQSEIIPSQTELTPEPFAQSGEGAAYDDAISPDHVVTGIDPAPADLPLEPVLP